MLYHCTLGFPATARLWRGVLTLRFGKHALAMASRYAQSMQLPATLDTAQAVAIEIEVVAGRVVKTLYRLAWTRNSDLCLVCHADGFVRTAWLNSRDDDHRTLDASKYATPERES